MVKNLPANVGDTGDTGWIPTYRGSPGVGNGNPLQYPCLENPMDTGAPWATVHGVAKSQTRLSAHTHTHTHTHSLQCHWHIGSAQWPYVPLAHGHFHLIDFCSTVMVYCMLILSFQISVSELTALTLKKCFLNGMQLLYNAMLVSAI